MAKVHVVIGGNYAGKQQRRCEQQGLAFCPCGWWVNDVAMRKTGQEKLLELVATP